MGPFFNAIQILIAILLIALVLLQARSGGAGAVFGQDSGVFRTRRGAERVIFQITVFVAILFAVLSVITVRFSH